MRWPKYWSFSFGIIPSKEHPGLISFRMECLDLLAVQRILKSLLQHHSSKGSILRRSAFFIVQLSHPYMTTGKTIALTRWTFVDKVISLLIIRELQIKTTMRFTSHQLEWLSSKNPQTVNAREVVERRKPSYPVGSVQFSSVTQSCPTLCDPMNRSTPGLPVHHHLPEFTQTHVHRVCDAIQPSHPRLSPSPSAPNPSQHQSLFQ